MLRKSVRRLGAAGLDVEGLYPHGVPRRTFPYREHPKQIHLAPAAGGFYMTKHAVGWPFNAPFEFLFYRVPALCFIAAVMYDLFIGGFPLPAEKENIPGQPTHYWFNNNGGKPHHFWQFQEGWYYPNESGAKRWFE